MAIEQVVGSLQFAPLAGANLTGKLMLFAKMSADNTVVVAAAATDSIVGVIREENVQGKPVTVQFGGIAKVIAGGTIVAGNRITADSNGKAVATAVAGNLVAGIAMHGADANDVVSVILIPGHVAAS